MSIKTKIKDFAVSIGISEIGFTKNPENGNSVIACLLPYYIPNERGNVALYARGRDYHAVVEDKLFEICSFLRKHGAKDCQIHVDKGKLNDREAAYSAGLGIRGRNRFLISPSLGSYFVIGQIRTDMDIESDHFTERLCLNCGKCVTACPSGALDNGFEMDRCVSYLTQKKGELTAEEEELIKKTGNCWGCDICQTVCPYNNNLSATCIPEFMNNRITLLTLKDFSELSDKEFKEKYRDYSFSWRGKQPLERNLRILQKE